MIRRGLSSLDEIEDVEQRESAAVVDVQLNLAVDVVDWNVVFGSVPKLSFAADPGSANGIP